MRRTTLPLLGGLLLLGACLDRELPTAVAPEAAAFATYAVGCDATALINAIHAANATPGPHVIDLSPGCGYALTSVNNTTEGPNGLPAITGDITINGNGAGLVRNSGGAFRLLYISPGATVSISDLTISGGAVTGASPAGDGGGILNRGTLTLTRVTVSINSAVNGGGGGIANRGTLTLTQSTVLGNSAASGGGIASAAALDGITSTTVFNSTISGNTASQRGGGVSSLSSEMRIGHSTIARNQAPSGGGVWAEHSPGVFETIVKGSIIWGNSTPPAFLSPSSPNDVAKGSGSAGFESLGHNLIGAAGANVDFSQEFNQPGDRTNVGPGSWLGSLAHNGGPTATHALLTGSPAIDTGTCTGFDHAPVNADQRGISRPRGGACDIGAYELLPADICLVTSGADSGTGSLRAAMANASCRNITIALIPSKTITLTSGTLSASDHVTIDGPGASLLTIRRDPNAARFRIFEVHAWKLVDISGLTISGGHTPGDSPDGGGIYIHRGGTLTLSSSTVSGNTATRNGGGIYVAGHLTLTDGTVSGNTAAGDGGGMMIDRRALIRNSTISGNTAGGHGGGINSYTYFPISETNTTILNSTISGNTAGQEGGGLRNGRGETRISHSTITHNRAPSGGGVWSENASYTFAKVKGSIIWGNTTGGAIPSPNDVAQWHGTTTWQTLGYNLIGAAGTNVDFATHFTATGDQTNVGPGSWLGPLTDNGGPTLTHAILDDSPAFNAGTCTDHNGVTVTTDQRGISRPRGGACDVGAIELALPMSLPPGGGYRFEGFSAPVKNMPEVNVAKAGQTIPLRWRVLDGRGRPVTNLNGSTVSVNVATNYDCAESITANQAEENSVGGTGLQNLRNGYYQFNWKTPKSYTGSCKTLTLTLEGTGLSPQALFQFTR